MQPRQSRDTVTPVRPRIVYFILLPLLHNSLRLGRRFEQLRNFARQHIPGGLVRFFQRHVNVLFVVRKERHVQQAVADRHCIAVGRLDRLRLVSRQRQRATPPRGQPEIERSSTPPYSGLSHYRKSATPDARQHATGLINSGTRRGFSRKYRAVNLASMEAVCSCLLILPVP